MSQRILQCIELAFATISSSSLKFSRKHMFGPASSNKPIFQSPWSPGCPPFSLLYTFRRLPDFLPRTIWNMIKVSTRSFRDCFKQRLWLRRWLFQGIFLLEKSTSHCKIQQLQGWASLLKATPWRTKAACWEFLCRKVLPFRRWRKFFNWLAWML